MEWCPSDHEVAIYEEWIVHHKYPYGGGMLDQPDWFFELRRKMGLLDEYHRLNKDLPAKQQDGFDE